MSAGPLQSSSPGRSLRRLTIVVALAFAIGSLGVLAAPRPTLAWDSGSFNSGSEQELFALTNQARASAGRKALHWDGALASIARSRSQDMIERDYFSHEIAGSGATSGT